jgi:bifunctional non-homologous end joining protein LigD
MLQTHARCGFPAVLNLFDSDEYLYELKIDGFRALAHVQDGKAELISRNGNVFRGFAELATWVAEHLKVESAVLDREIACIDEEGRPTERLRREQQRPCA